MASAPQTWHPAASSPAVLRRCFVLSFTLTWCWAIHRSQPMHGLIPCFLALSAVLAVWLMAMPRVASGRLCWQHPDWLWHSTQGRPLTVSLVPVIDVGSILCLRMSPSNADDRAIWRWPQWVWLCRTDTVSWKALRLALNCTPTIERRSR